MQIVHGTIVTLRADADPTIALQGALLPPKAVGRAAITNEKGFGTLLAAIEDYDGWPTIRALRRMGYGVDEVTAHGFRVTASTILSTRAVIRRVEAILAHQDKNTIRRTYNRSTYWAQRVKLIQEWADLLDTLRTLPDDR